MRVFVALFAALAAAVPAYAGDGKLLLTGGVSSIDGAAGGGLTPWAVTTGYGSEGQWSATGSFTRVATRDYGLSGYGIAASVNERVEISLARQDFATRATGTALGLPGLHLKQDIVGAKLLVSGDAVLDSDSLMPALALGVEAKRLDAGGLKPTLESLGARDHGVDLYASATKLFLAQGLLVNLTLRATRANQNGLLGFGGTASDHLSIEPEVSVAWLLRRNLVVGAEYRAKPDKLNPSALGAGLREDDWKDLFIAWAPNKHVSLTLAWVDLGRIVPAVQPRRQSGAYASAQIAY
ncbi:MAG: DUF3034 family protein [Caldimonas sp.]